MGFEPNAERRLKMLWATTPDRTLRHELAVAVAADEDYRMAFSPSADLLRRISACAACELRDPRDGRDGLCESHRAQWNLEMCARDDRQTATGPALDRILDEVLSTEVNARQLLTALDRQLRALHLVWEAHERGAIELPERIAESVRTARASTPGFLPAGRPSIRQAS